MSVHNSPLDVVDVGVVFKSSLKEAGFFTELGNVGLVIVCEHLVTHDGISNLRQREKEIETERERQREREKYPDKIHKADIMKTDQ